MDDMINKLLCEILMVFNVEIIFWNEKSNNILYRIEQNLRDVPTISIADYCQEMQLNISAYLSIPCSSKT